MPTPNQPTAGALRAARVLCPQVAYGVDHGHFVPEMLTGRALAVDKETRLPDLLQALQSALRYIEVRVAYQGAMTADQVEARIKEEYFPAQVAIGANSCNTLASFDIRATRELLAKAKV